MRYKNRTMPDIVQTSIRLPLELLLRADRLLEQEPVSVPVKLRSDILRRALERGLDELEHKRREVSKG